jgi:hypothetical protein
MLFSGFGIGELPNDPFNSLPASPGFCAIGVFSSTLHGNGFQVRIIGGLQRKDKDECHPTFKYKSRR